MAKKKYESNELVIIGGRNDGAGGVVFRVMTPISPNSCWITPTTGNRKEMFENLKDYEGLKLSVKSMGLDKYGCPIGIKSATVVKTDG